MASSCGSLSFVSLNRQIPIPNSLFPPPPAFPKRTRTTTTKIKASFKDLLSMNSRVPPAASPNDLFLSKLASASISSPDKLLLPSDPDAFPFLDVLQGPTMLHPAEVERVSYRGGRRRRKSPPPDIASLLLSGRIVYIGLPLVSAVTELIIAQLLYLQTDDATKPINLYINSTGTVREDKQIVALEYEGFAIYDVLTSLKTEIRTIAIGAADNFACLLLAAGAKGKRFMTPSASASIKQPRVPASGDLPAKTAIIRANEAVHNKQTLIKLLAKHTGNSVETVAKAMESSFCMDYKEAIEFGVIDHVWQAEKKMGKVFTKEDRKAMIKRDRS